MRLTTRTEDGRAIIWVEPECDTGKMVEETAKKTRAVISKLARYEDLEEPSPITGLKRCPMCGDYGVISYYPNLNLPYIPGCMNENCICWDTGLGFKTKEEAIAAWNRRVGEQE